MSDELPVFEPVKPVGVCGGCGHSLYSHTSHCRAALGPKDDCPLFSDEWNRGKRVRDMMNAWQPRKGEL